MNFADLSIFFDAKSYTSKQTSRTHKNTTTQHRETYLSLILCSTNLAFVWVNFLTVSYPI